MKSRSIDAFNSSSTAALYFGCVSRSTSACQFVWILADIALTSMMVINLISVGGLSKEVIADTRVYEADERDEIDIPQVEESV